MKSYLFWYELHTVVFAVPPSNLINIAEYVYGLSPESFLMLFVFVCIFSTLFGHVCYVYTPGRYLNSHASTFGPVSC